MDNFYKLVNGTSNIVLIKEILSVVLPVIIIISLQKMHKFLLFFIR